MKYIRLPLCCLALVLLAPVSYAMEMSVKVEFACKDLKVQESLVRAFDVVSLNPTHSETQYNDKIAALESELQKLSDVTALIDTFDYFDQYIDGLESIEQRGVRIGRAVVRYRFGW